MKRQGDLFDFEDLENAATTLAKLYLDWEQLDGNERDRSHVRGRKTDDCLRELAAILRRDLRPLCLLKKGVLRDPLLMRAVAAMSGTSLSIMERNSPRHFPIVMKALVLRESVLRDVVKEMTAHRDAIIWNKRSPNKGPFASWDIAEIEDRALAKLAILCRHRLGALNEIHRSDRELVKLAVSLDAMDFEVASDDLRSDREIIMIAVCNPGIEIDNPLGFVSPKYQADREIAELAVLFSANALDALSDELKADRDLVELAVRNFGVSFKHADECLHGDRELAQLAVINSYNALQNLEADWSGDAEIVKLVAQSWAKDLVPRT